MKIPETIRWKSTGRTLGQGGQAQVQEVEDTKGEFPGKYALKALAKGKSQQAYERFFREVNAIKQLNHPYIVKVIDSSEPANDFHYYVMEYLEGARPLLKVIGSDDNPYYCNPLAAIDLFSMICQAISACEGNAPPIVHRDLSPSNIILIPDGTIRIIDFGLCQSEGDETITLTDEGVGTINYMAPECESGAVGYIGTWSDLYSAGKILWSAVTGQRVFAREKPAFTSKSLGKIFPYNSDVWHLYHILSRTIRHDSSNRWRRTEDALLAYNSVRRLILGGYPPLEEIYKDCPVCGVGSLKDFQGSHMVFGNPNPQGIYAKQCDYCGICLAVNGQLLRNRLNEMDTLE